MKYLKKFENFDSYIADDELEDDTMHTYPKSVEEEEEEVTQDEEGWEEEDWTEEDDMRQPEPPQVEEITLEKKKAKGLPPWLKKGKKKDEEEGDKKPAKGLSKAQSKLPEGLRKAIEAKKNKK